MKRSLTLLFLLTANSRNVASQETCDESKCRTLNDESTLGYWWLPPSDDPMAGGFSCWAPAGSDRDALLCADGYEGRPTDVTREVDGVGHVWYTCCPPDFTGEVEQTCTDQMCPPSTFSCWGAPDGLAPLTCGDNEEYKYPRKTGAMVEMEHVDMIYNLTQYLCCITDMEDGVPEESNDLNGDLLYDSCSVTSCTSLDGANGPGDCWAGKSADVRLCGSLSTHTLFLIPFALQMGSPNPSPAPKTTNFDMLVAMDMTISTSSTFTMFAALHLISMQRKAKLSFGMDYILLSLFKAVSRSLQQSYVPSSP